MDKKTQKALTKFVDKFLQHYVKYNGYAVSFLVKEIIKIVDKK